MLPILPMVFDRKQSSDFKWSLSFRCCDYILNSKRAFSAENFSPLTFACAGSFIKIISHKFPFLLSPRIYYAIFSHDYVAKTFGLLISSQSYSTLDYRRWIQYMEASGSVWCSGFCKTNYSGCSLTIFPVFFTRRYLALFAKISLICFSSSFTNPPNDFQRKLRKYLRNVGILWMNTSEKLDF